MRDKFDFQRIFESSMNDAFPPEYRDSNKDYADSDDTAAMLKMDPDEFDEMVTCMIAIVKGMITTAVDRDHLDSEDFNMMMNSAVANTLVCTLILKRGMDSDLSKPPVVDKYPMTLMAEAHIRNHLLDGADLNNIWPLPLAEEVASEFDPVHAFMVGVVCGSQRG
jgi:hypothetical protein